MFCPCEIPRAICLMVVLTTASACEPNTEETSPAPQPSAAEPAAQAEPAVAGEKTIVLTRPDSVLVVYDSIARRIAAWSPNAIEVWRYQLPGTEPVIGQLVAAADSTIYVRVSTTLYAINPQGELAWQVELPPIGDPPRLFAPTALSNSGVVLARTPAQLVAYDNRGVEMWVFNMPLNEELRTPPRAAKDGTIYVGTSVGIVAVNSRGVLNWYRQRNLPVANEEEAPVAP